MERSGYKYAITRAMAAEIEGDERTDYSDAGVAAEAKVLDGLVVSTDRVFDRLQGVKRIW